MVAQIYLIRHGETEWTISGRHTGITEVPLTPHGEAEARECGRQLRAIKFQRVLTSPRVRARRTCELAAFHVPTEIDDDLREWTYGDYEGLLIGEILERRPGWNIFLHGCPNGESPDQVSARADRLIAKLRQMDGTVALVSHGHFTRVLASRWVEMPVRNGQIFASNTASIGILGFSGNNGRPLIQLWNRGTSLS